MPWIGLDIGGANIKLVTADGAATNQPFELWRQPEQLTAALARLLGSQAPDRLAVTMTGELADCFPTKREGVRQIVESVSNAWPNAEIAIYGVDGEFHSYAAVQESPPVAAASNWHALGSYCARFLPSGGGLVIDLGSTTTDIIPVFERRVATESTTDIDRLLAGELVYGGFTRTPVCAIVDELPLGDRVCPVAAEWFATTADVYLLLGWLSENSDVPTADGQPLTTEYARRRLARCVCGDGESVPAEYLLAMAKAVADAQEEQIIRALQRVSQRRRGGDEHVLVSGSGIDLAAQIVTRHLPDAAILRLDELVGRDQSVCGCALAVATLAAEEYGE